MLDQLTAECDAEIARYAPALLRVTTLDLTDDETAALVRLLRHAIDDDAYPLSSRLAPLCSILAKLPVARATAAVESARGALRPAAGDEDETLSQAADDARQRRCGVRAADRVVSRLRPADRARTADAVLTRGPLD